MADLKIMTLNVRSLGDYMNRKSNVIFLQETHSMKYIERRWITEWGGPIYYSHGTSSARGAVILIKHKTNIKIHRSIKDKEGRYVALDVTREYSR